MQLMVKSTFLNTLFWLLFWSVSQTWIPTLCLGSTGLACKYLKLSPPAHTPLSIQYIVMCTNRLTANIVWIKSYSNMVNATLFKVPPGGADLSYLRVLSLRGINVTQHLYQSEARWTALLRHLIASARKTKRRNKGPCWFHTQGH